MNRLTLNVLLAALITLLCAGNYALAGDKKDSVIRDVDGQIRDFRRQGQVSVVMYTNGDLEDESRKVSASLDSFRVRKDFAFIQVLDMRGEVPPVIRNTVVKEVRRQLDKEATRLAPIYRKFGSSRDPRKDMATVVDFSGNVLGRFNWGNHYENVRIVIYNKKGDLVQRWDKIPDTASLSHQIKSLL